MYKNNLFTVYQIRNTKEESIKSIKMIHFSDLSKNLVNKFSSSVKVSCLYDILIFGTFVRRISFPAEPSCLRIPRVYDMGRYHIT